MITAPERSKEQTISEPHSRAQGHLELVDWEKTAKDAAAERYPKRTDPIRRTLFDRLYNVSIILLLVLTVIAIGASLAHL